MFFHVQLLVVLRDFSHTCSLSFTAQFLSMCEVKIVRDDCCGCVECKVAPLSVSLPDQITH